MMFFDTNVDCIFFLESVFIDVDHYQENIEAKQNKTLENLGEIQAAIAFINDVITLLYSVDVFIFCRY